MDERLRFVGDYTRGEMDVAELCRRYEISRKTGYKWIARYEADGGAGLLDRSRRPRTCPHRTAAEVEAELERDAADGGVHADAVALKGFDDGAREERPGRGEEHGRDRQEAWLQVVHR